MTHYYAELFAGAGGMSMGLEAAGFVPFAHAEIEPNARAVLRKHWPTVRLDGDVTQLNGKDYAGITLLSGGSPCQDLSVAGKRAGLDGSRSSLFYEQVRIWNESGAPYLLWENVYGALSSNGGKDFAAVLSALVGANVDVPVVGRGKSAKPKWQRAGMASGPAGVAAWRVLDLQHISGRDLPAPPQRRVRVFVLAARAGGVNPAEVLALSEGVCGHPSPRQQAREGTTDRAAGGVGAGGVIGFLPTGGTHGVAAGDVSPSIKVGSGIGIPSAPAVLAFHHTQTPISGEMVPAIGRTTNGMGVICTTGDITPALTHEGADASEDGTGRGTPIVARMVAFGEYATDGTASTIKQRDYKDATDLVIGGRPRRLTPRECEALMSWPTNWTQYGRKEDGTVYELSDTARYRLCGNGVGSTCAEWIGSRLLHTLTRDTL